MDHAYPVCWYLLWTTVFGVGILARRMEEQIKKFIYRWDNVCFPELMQAIPNSSGDRTLCHQNENLIFWEDMSQAFVEAIQTLEESRLIIYRPIFSRQEAMLIYAPHGGGLQYPIARRIHKYARPHWLPVVLCRP